MTNRRDTPEAETARNWKFAIGLAREFYDKRGAGVLPHKIVAGLASGGERDARPAEQPNVIENPALRPV